MRAQPVGDSAVLLEFGTAIDPDVFDAILALEAALIANPPQGLRETVPAYVSLLLVFDPLVTDADTIVAAALRAQTDAIPRPAPTLHHVPMCSDADLAPDLAEITAHTGVGPDALLAAFCAAELRVYMYGFAPGYAYMDGVPAALHLPRKPVPVRSRPAGSVMIAGGQCLITSLPMPTGWWVIGATRTAVLRDDEARPFLLQPGDTVRFVPQPRADFDAS